MSCLLEDSKEREQSYLKEDIRRNDPFWLYPFFLLGSVFWPKYPSPKMFAFYGSQEGDLLSSSFWKAARRLSSVGRGWISVMLENCE